MEDCISLFAKDRILGTYLCVAVTVASKYLCRQFRVTHSYYIYQYQLGAMDGYGCIEHCQEVGTKRAAGCGKLFEVEGKEFQMRKRC